jgi:hypothetical protein
MASTKAVANPASIIPHNNSLLAGGTKLRQTEFVADGEGNEAEGRRRNHTQSFHGFIRGKAEAVDAEPPKKIRADQHARHQVGGDIREVKFRQFDNTGHHQTAVIAMEWIKAAS